VTTAAAGVAVVDLASTPLRELNQRLHDLDGVDPEPRCWQILNPNGAHAVACGPGPGSSGPAETLLPEDECNIRSRCPAPGVMDMMPYG